MINDVPCPFCGSMNPQTTVRCRTCDRKLPVPGQEPASPTGRWKTVLRILFFAVILGTLVLVLQSPEVHGVVDEEAAVDEFYRELVAMDHAVRRQREDFWTITEGEANAYLREVVNANHADGQAGWRKLVGVNVDFQPQSAVVGITHKWGPLELTQRMDVQRISDAPEGQMPWELESFYVGKLPLPKFLQPLVVKNILKAFSGFERDLTVLRRVSEVHLDNEKAYLVNRRKPV